MFTGLATKFVLPVQYVRASGVLASVTCFNRAGLAKVGSLGPISFDETPPTFGETALVMSSPRVAALGPDSTPRGWDVTSATPVELTIDPYAILDVDAGPPMMATATVLASDGAPVGD